MNHTGKQVKKLRKIGFTMAASVVAISLISGCSGNSASLHLLRAQIREKK
jgi:outer membrane murein-binding lipoprotein Lpp